MTEPAKRPDQTAGSGQQSPSGAPPASGGAPATVPQQQERVPVQIEDSKLVASYANFCRVTGTPEEVILDFALNSQPLEATTQPVSISQRIILNPYTAKRLLYALQMSVERHEATFGALETNVARRLRPATGPDQPQPAAPF